jgi:uncharacterized protein (DUF433 family)
MDHPRIMQDQKIMSGKPVIRGTRVPVEIILRLLGQGVSTEQMLEGYPTITREDILAAQSYAADVLAAESASVAAE